MSLQPQVLLHMALSLLDQMVLSLCHNTSSSLYFPRCAYLFLFSPQAAKDDFFKHSESAGPEQS